MKAIETSYKGFRFRSRLEARWALFFDELGIKWDYEKEGYNLGKKLGFYLPDFWLPDMRCWLEIKPEYPTESEKSKLELMAFETGSMGCIAYGDLLRNYSLMVFMYDFAEDHGGWGRNEYAEWLTCERCGSTYIGLGESGREYSYDDCGETPYRYCGCQSRTPVRKPITMAIMAARAARFEHGEKP